MARERLRTTREVATNVIWYTMARRILNVSNAPRNKRTMYLYHSASLLLSENTSVSGIKKFPMVQDPLCNCVIGTLFM